MTGLSTTSSPTFESFGQPAPGAEVIVSLANCASLQVPRPEATEGFTDMPSGRTTTAFLACDVARSVGLSRGSLSLSRVKSYPVGELARSVESRPAEIGSNASWSQPSSGGVELLVETGAEDC